MSEIIGRIDFSKYAFYRIYYDSRYGNWYKSEIEKFRQFKVPVFLQKKKRNRKKTARINFSDSTILIIRSGKANASTFIKIRELEFP